MNIFKKLKRKYSSQYYVQIVYKTIMGREPDARGLAHFTDVYNKSGDLSVVIDQLANSDEIRNSINHTWTFSNSLVNQVPSNETLIWKNNNSVEGLSDKNFYPHNILIVKLDHIGDFILSIDSVLLLKESFPEANFSLLCASWNTSIAKATGLFNEVYTCDLLNSRADQGEFSINKNVIDVLPKKMFDLAIDLRVQPDTRVILDYIFSLFKCGYESPYCSNKIDITLSQPQCKGLDDFEYNSKSHMFALAARVVHAFKISPKVEEYIHKSAKFDSSIKETFNDKRPNIIVQPFSGASIKNWSLENYIALIQKIIRDFDAQVYILGSISDTSNEVIKKLANIHENVHVLIGETSILESISLIQSCDLYIGNDTGLTHISAALNRPTIVIFSGTEITNLFAPLNKSVNLIRFPVSCHPCYLSRIEDCINDHECMRSIEWEQVYSVTKDVLSFFPNLYSDKSVFIRI